METLGRVTTRNSKRQITFTKEELDGLGVAPRETVTLWTGEGMKHLVICKPETEKPPVASR